jgi:hypothetical protein
MKNHVLLTVASLLILLVTFHLSDDIIRGYVGGGAGNLITVPITVVWLYGALVLGERRSGQIIMLLGSLLALLVPYLHIGTGAGVGGRVARTSGAFFFIWTIQAIGVTAPFSVVLSLGGPKSKPDPGQECYTTHKWRVG